MKSSNHPAHLSMLDKLLDSSLSAASTALSNSIAARPRRMNATELIDFWNQAAVVVMTTVGSGGQPHSAPVHARLIGDHLELVIYDDSRRRRDLVSNPRTSFCTWSDSGQVVLMYGRASEVVGSLRPARDGADGTERSVVEIKVALSKVYAMGARTKS